MSARTALLAAAAVLTLAAGCGGDGPTPAADLAASTESSATATGSSVPTTDAPTTEELLGCLTGAGLEARTVATTPYGVEDPVSVVVVSGLESYDGAHDQGAMLYVFDDAATAAANAAVVTLGQSDDPTNEMYGVHGNVVRAMSMILQPAPHTDDEQAVLDCLPPTEATDPTGETSPGGTTPSGSTPSGTGEALLECLTGSGLTATLEGEDADDVGVHSAQARVVVTELTGSISGARIWVFADAATRAEHTGDIWFGATPSPRLLERGNTLTLLDAEPADGDLAVAAVEQCLPA